jgi:signal transduction histidine kinase
VEHRPHPPCPGASRFGIVCYFRNVTAEVLGRKEREFLSRASASRARSRPRVHLKDEFLAILSHELRSPAERDRGLEPTS